MASICNLPREIILYIFQIYLETESQRSLFEVIYNVCSYWRDLCMDISLWTKFDGTLSFQKLMKLCRSGSLNNTREIKLSPIENIEELPKLFSTLSNLYAIDFSDIKLTKDILQVVASSCPYIREIRFPKCVNCRAKEKINCDILGSYLKISGVNLIVINLSYTSITTFTPTFKCIPDCCPNLEQLHLTNIICNFATFPTKYVQTKCPKLKVLHLDHNVNVTATKYTEGFPNLEIFTYPDTTGQMISDKQFSCIVFNSLNLKFLNLTNCNISADILCSLPACSIEYLYIPKSKICNSSNLNDVIKKWSHSLKHVDISSTSQYGINKVVMNLISTSESKLNCLNLSFTQITADVVEQVIKKCHLDILCLESCRNLGRGMKKVYYGKSELEILSNKLKAFIKISNEEMSCD